MMSYEQPTLEMETKLLTRATGSFIVETIKEMQLETCLRKPNTYALDPRTSIAQRTDPKIWFLATRNI